MVLHNGESEGIPHSAKIDTDQLCCPHCGTKLRWALVSDEMVSRNLARSSEGPRIVPNAPVETPGPVVESCGDSLLLLEAIEKRAILTAMRRAGNDKKLATRLLGIGKTTLYRKLKEYDFDPLSTLVSADIASATTGTGIIQGAPAEKNETIGTVEPTNQHNPLEDAEKTAILNAMQEAENDRRLVAQRLGIGRTTLYRRLKKYGFPLSRRPRRKAAREI
jgi:transcriptional regulator with PAS, ATPase and Fis domain